MKRVSFALLAAVCLALFAQPALAANQQKVSDAIHGGQQWIINKQLGDGSWSDSRYGNPNTSTAFAVAALLETGVSWQYTGITRGIQYIMDHAVDRGGGLIELGSQDGEQNYAHNSCLLALALYAAQADNVPITLTNLINGAKLFTESYQVNNPGSSCHGSWGYDRWDNCGDNSNTQFAVMGLWYANRFLGVSSATEPWATANYAWLQYTFRDLGSGRGSFGYTSPWTYGTMTGSGLWQLAMIGKSDDPMVTAAANWFSYTPNYLWSGVPSPFYASPTTAYYYFIYAMAKALTATVGAQNLLGPEQRPWTTDLVNEMVDNKAIW
ncbi:MAG: hypothetical protein AB1921_11650, partial [Thermodesulfobacteriota bacterium]